MKNKINLGMNVELSVFNSDFAKTVDLINHETKTQINLGCNLK